MVTITVWKGKERIMVLFLFFCCIFEMFFCIYLLAHIGALLYRIVFSKNTRHIYSLSNSLPLCICLPA